MDANATIPFVVALGASADGLDGLERFFAHVPPHTGMAFVVIQHLAADFDSQMADILSRAPRCRCGSRRTVPASSRTRCT